MSREKQREVYNILCMNQKENDNRKTVTCKIKFVDSLTH